MTTQAPRSPSLAPLTGKLEQGRRHTCSRRSLHRLARALDVDITELLGPARPASAAGPDQGRILAIRDTLTSVDDLLGELDDADAPNPAELTRAVVYSWGLYWQAGMATSTPPCAPYLCGGVPKS